MSVRALAGSEMRKHERDSRAQINSIVRRPQNKTGVRLSRPIHSKVCRPAILRSGYHGLSLIRVRTLSSSPIYRCGDVKVSLPGLNRAVAVCSVGIQGIDLGVRSAVRHATIDVVSHDGGGRARTPGKGNTVLGRSRATAGQGLLSRRIGSIAGEGCARRCRTAGLGREADGEGHALSRRQRDRQSQTAHGELGSAHVGARYGDAGAGGSERGGQTLALPHRDATEAQCGRVHGQLARDSRGPGQRNGKRGIRSVGDDGNRSSGAAAGSRRKHRAEGKALSGTQSQRKTQSGDVKASAGDSGLSHRNGGAAGIGQCL